MPSTDDTTAVGLLRRQHDELKSMMRDIRASAPTIRPGLFSEFKRYLAAHEAFEIEVIHPAVKRLRPDGRSDVDQSLMEERSASNEIARLETLDATTEDFERNFAAFQQAVVDHAEHEEHDEFPLLAKVDEGDESQRIVAELDRALQAHSAADVLEDGDGRDSTFQQILESARSGYRNAPIREGKQPMPERSPGPSVKDKGLYEALRDEGNSKEKSARIANAAARTSRQAIGRKGGRAGDYEDMTKQQLYQRAKTVGIEGRSRMSKPELISALRNH